MLKLVAATAVVAMAVAFNFSQRLGLEGEMLYAMAHTFLQLSVIGFVLQFIFTQKNALWLRVQGAAPQLRVRRRRLRHRRGFQRGRRRVVRREEVARRHGQAGVGRAHAGRRRQRLRQAVRRARGRHLLGFYGVFLVVWVLDSVVLEVRLWRSAAVQGEGQLQPHPYSTRTRRARRLTSGRICIFFSCFYLGEISVLSVWDCSTRMLNCLFSSERVPQITQISECQKELYNHTFSSSASTPHTNESTSEPKKSRVEFSHSDLIGDPGKRKPIDDYQPEIRDQVKSYALNGPTQPRNIIFPRKWMSGEFRSFQKTWYDEFDWLEYSEYKNAAYCLYCYLFFNSAKPEKFGSSVFAHQGFVNWKKAKDIFNNHNVCKTHVEARLKCEDFMNQKTNVGRKLVQISKEEEKRYEIRLTASLGVARFLIMQGDAFRGHDESSTSLNKGTYTEIYAEDFDIGDLTVLPNELKSFVNRARRTPEFLGCTELGKVAEIMVKTNMNTSYQLVYRLIELTLILPVATVSDERIFSAMSIIKTDLRSKMGDEWLNDLMICYNEKEIFRKICNEKNQKEVSRDEEMSYVIA
ncbi:uncharacterized protein LOC120669495 [Panicum virgatum]|uniref:uncharacterized protein LOC120669495 n=1 Tax=Panicum virgatum TaxID=38727 RepID=UPI0019D55B75|nr:uncharacterized protein LOC120669495 [Panicum virgatum]